MILINFLDSESEQIKGFIIVPHTPALIPGMKVNYTVENFVPGEEEIGSFEISGTVEKVEYNFAKIIELVGESRSTNSGFDIFVYLKIDD